VEFVWLLACIISAAVCYRIGLKRGQDIRHCDYASVPVLELLAHGAPLKEVLEAIVLGVENEQMFCSIMLLDTEGKRLLTGAAPSLPDYFNAALNGMEIGIGAGSCGTCAFSGQRVIVEDIQEHTYWAPYQEIALQAALRSCWCEPVCSASGKVLGTLAFYHKHVQKPNEADLQLIAQTVNLAEIALEQSSNDQLLRAREKLLLDTLENVSAYIYVKDTQGRYLFANQLLRQLFDAPMEEIVGYDDYKFYDADTAASLHTDDLKVLQKGETIKTEQTSLNILTGLSAIYLSVRLPLRNHDGSIYALCGISTDITERCDIEEHMRHMAQYDALTHLPNRALFGDRLQQALLIAKREQKQLALMFLDLDKFKPVNDTYGHAMGDLLLKESALRIQDCLRASDTAARIGGDEFVVLLTSIESEQDAVMVGEKIRLALNQPFELAGHSLYISSSIGIAVYPEHGLDEKLLVKSADTAMYHAKKNGRNNVQLYQTGQ
jgi:diguanylate cyclase (GGDEF)-like protein